MRSIQTCIIALSCLLSFVYADSIGKVHGMAMNGDLKYPNGFTHFEYVNPDAPKGGYFVTDALGTFDSFNPFAIKGNSAQGLGLLFDTLTSQSLDEPFSEYGVLAEYMELSPKKDAITFYINKKARFHDGKPVTAEDVAYSFNALVSIPNPIYKRYYSDVTEVKVLDTHTVKFVFKDGNNVELPMILGQLTVIPKHWWEKKDLSKSFMDVPLGSGPYKIKDFQSGKFIVYERNKEYWGRDIPANKGSFNYDYVKYDYYRDRTVGLEAFKAGEYDFRQENTAKSWATLYTGDVFDEGLIKKKEIAHENPAGMQAFFFNMRRDLFKDRRVRQAISLAFDFEWANKKLFYGQYIRNDSFFTNSDMAARGKPSEAELALLEPLRDKLRPEVFGEVYRHPKTDGSGQFRKLRREASRLLKEAGWKVQKGKLIKDGKPFEFEILLVLPDFERIVMPFKKNLEKLGITLNIRTVDTSQYLNRMRDYDYDMVIGTIPQSLSPGNEQRYFFHSTAADTPGTRNFMGLKHPAVDVLIEKIINAPTREELITACRAMDRVLLQEHFAIPNWHINKFRVAYWNKFSHPEISPKYAIGINTWWIDSQKAEKLFKAKPGLIRR